MLGVGVRTHSVTRFSPFFLLFGINPRIPGDISPPSVIWKPLDEIEALVEREGFTNRELEELGVARGQAYTRTLASKESMKTNNDREFYFELDDWAKIKDYHKTKFQFHWKGPYIVHGFGYFLTYWLRTPKGDIIKNLVNQSNMAPWTARLANNEDFFFGFVDNDGPSEVEEEQEAFPE